MRKHVTKDALIIIDCQDDWGFELRRKKFHLSIPRLVNRFKRKSLPIINVTFRGCGDVLPEIQKSISGYDNLIRTYKDSCDGSIGLSRHIRSNKLTKYRLHVVGCFTDQCVYDTCAGLKSKIKDVDISVYHKFTKACMYTKEDGFKKLGIKYKRSSISLARK